MNKKGFTLTEILAVIVVLGIVGTIATFSVQKILNDSKEKMLESKQKMIAESAIVYGQDNQNYLSQTCTINDKTYNHCFEISVQTLLNDKYLKSDETCENQICVINNVDGSSLNDTIIKVYIDNNRITAKYPID